MRPCVVVIFLLLSILVYRVWSLPMEDDSGSNLTTSSVREAKSEDDIETSRRRRKGNKLLLPLLFGALLIKSIIFPLAFKAMAVMTSIAVLLSAMSLIISVGYIRVAFKSHHPTYHRPHRVRVIHDHANWAKDDDQVKPNYYNLESVDYESPIAVEQLHHSYGNIR